MNEPEKTIDQAGAPNETGAPPAQAESDPPNAADEPVGKPTDGEGEEEADPAKAREKPKPARERTVSKRKKKEPEAPSPPHPLEAPMKGRFGERILSFDEVKGHCAPVVAAGDLVEVCRELRDDLGYTYLRCLSGIDRGDQLEVAYNLLNLDTKEELVLKVKLDPESPAVPTLCPLWKTADWLERETYDLFGIEFEGHPDLRRILLPDDWEGHPLRKDYDYRRD